MQEDILLQTPVRFTTNIDCCKRYMGNISGLPLDRINPAIGDRVRVYKDSALHVWLKVVGRRWTMTNGAQPVLECELHLEDGWTIPMLEKALRS
jgi:hypothetical protein